MISGLASITLIYLPSENEDAAWFGFEILMWIAMPIAGLGLSYGMHFLVRKYIFEHSQARRRIMILIPYYICFASTVMFFFSTTKNYLRYNKNQVKEDKISWGWYLLAMVLFPLMSLVLSRFYMLRRGRAMNKISLDYYAATFMQKEISHYLPDIVNSMKFWDNSPILRVYFDEREVIE